MVKNLECKGTEGKLSECEGDYDTSDCSHE